MARGPRPTVSARRESASAGWGRFRRVQQRRYRAGQLGRRRFRRRPESSSSRPTSGLRKRSRRAPPGCGCVRYQHGRYWRDNLIRRPLPGHGGVPGGGGTNTTTNNTVNGGVGGSGSGGDFNIDGGDGFFGGVMNGAATKTGAGGANPLGFNARPSTSNATPVAGQNYGGGGASVSTAAASSAGSAGAAGVVIVEMIDEAAFTRRAHPYGLGGGPVFFDLGQAWGLPPSSPLVCCRTPIRLPRVSTSPTSAAIRAASYAARRRVTTCPPLPAATRHRRRATTYYGHRPGQGRGQDGGQVAIRPEVWPADGQVLWPPATAVPRPPVPRLV